MILEDMVELVRQSKYYGVERMIAENYLQSLVEHIRYVQEAGEMIGVSTIQLAEHDKSKFDSYEFPGYALHFKGRGAPDLFALAWLHHIHANPHHWQHWIFPDGFTPKGSNVENGVCIMPYPYILEMIADWLGASRAYTGQWDMASWLVENLPKIRVHSRTAEYLRDVLDHIGYADMVNFDWRHAK